MKFAEPIDLDEDIAPNMTPMIDVVFLLIIFFLTAAQLSVGSETDIRLPVASEARSRERVNPNSITIDIHSAPEGAVFSISGRGYGYGDLMKKLRNHVQSAELLGNAAPPIILRADYRVPYRHIQELMFDCAAAGITLFDFQATTEEDLQ